MGGATKMNVVNWRESSVSGREWTLKKEPFQMQSNDYMQVPAKWVELFVYSFLADSLHQPMDVVQTCKTGADCSTNGQDGIACIAGECKRSFTYFHDAVSPSLFAWDIYRYQILDRSMPIYTEPQWGSPPFLLRLFVQGSAIEEYGVLVIGAVLTIGVGIFAALRITTLMIKYKMV